MPFPLAHPAAVLPLRRYCPRWLSFPALVIGSLSPDAGYLFGQAGGPDWGTFSHGLLGSVAFCLPVGIVLLALFYGLRSPVVRLLPAPYQQAFLPFCRRPLGPLWVVVFSLLIGIWTHEVWDSFTHNEGWCVEHLPVLQCAVFSVAGRTARVCHLLWYGCSFAGVLWLFLAFDKWKQASVNGDARAPSKGGLWYAVLIALLVLPVELAHHLLGSGRLGFYLIAGVCALPVLGVALKLGHVRK